MKIAKAPGLLGGTFAHYAYPKSHFHGASDVQSGIQWTIHRGLGFGHSHVCQPRRNDGLALFEPLLDGRIGF